MGSTSNDAVSVSFSLGDEPKKLTDSAALSHELIRVYSGFSVFAYGYQVTIYLIAIYINILELYSASL